MSNINKNIHSFPLEKQKTVYKILKQFHFQLNLFEWLNYEDWTERIHHRNLFEIKHRHFPLLISISNVIYNCLYYDGKAITFIYGPKNLTIMLLESFLTDIHNINDYNKFVLKHDL